MLVLNHTALDYVETARRRPMIFQDGEFRRNADSKPMVFDGWDYVPIEPGTAAETQLVAEDALTKRDAPSASAPL
jgi:hypothetical protein